NPQQTMVRPSLSMNIPQGQTQYQAPFTQQANSPYFSQLPSHLPGLPQGKYTQSPMMTATSPIATLPAGYPTSLAMQQQFNHLGNSAHSNSPSSANGQPHLQYSQASPHAALLTQNNPTFDFHQLMAGQMDANAIMQDFAGEAGMLSNDSQGLQSGSIFAAEPISLEQKPDDDEPKDIESSTAMAQPPPVPEAAAKPSKKSTRRSSRAPATPGEVAEPKSSAKPKSKTGAAATPTAESTSDHLKCLQLRSNNIALEKDIQLLKKTIHAYDTKLKRLKFERRLLVGALAAADDNGNNKRALEDTSESEVRRPERLTPQQLDEGGTDIASEADAVDTMTPKTKAKKKKRAKLLDPNAPKRSANAFLMFSDLQRNMFREQRRILAKRDPHSELLPSLNNITKALGAKWKALDEEDRKLYQDMFKEQVVQYNLEMREYLLIHPNAPVEGTKEPLPADWTDPGAPKRPVHPFFVFCEMEEERIKNEETVERTDEEEEEYLQIVSTALTTRWRLLTDAEKEHYNQLYEKSKKRYQEYLDEKKSRFSLPATPKLNMDDVAEDHDEEEEGDDGQSLLFNDSLIEQSPEH
ncbi:hypothetical protein HDU91_007355, partial [Kappamyces sp. JEL0680]